MSPSEAMGLGVGLAVSLLGPRLARAEDPPQAARLKYSAPDGCPDEHFFRNATASRLGGADPFSSSAGPGIEITVRRRAKKGDYVSKIEIFDENGKSGGEMDPIDDPDCAQVVEAAAFAIQPFVRPLARRREPPAEVPAAVVPPPAPQPPPQPECPKPPPPVVARPEAAPAREPDPGPPLSMRGPPDPLPGLQFLFGAAGWAEQVAAEQGSIGVTIDAGVRWRFFSAAIEGHVDPPFGYTQSPWGKLSSARTSAALLACLHFEWLVGCGLGDVGSILFPIAPAPTPTKGYGAVGLRLGVNFPVVPGRIFIPVAVEMRRTFDPSVITRVGQIVYQTADTGWGLGFGILFVLDKP